MTPRENLNMLIELFIKKGNTFNWVSRDWAREAMAAKRLCIRYKDFDFFYTLLEYQNRFNSLLGLTKKDIQLEMDKRYAFFLEEKRVKKDYIERDPVTNNNN